MEDRKAVTDDSPPPTEPAAVSSYHFLHFHRFQQAFSTKVKGDCDFNNQKKTITEITTT